MKRVICVGNRYEPRDAAGPLVFDALSGVDLPDDVEVVDGGLAGLDLLRHVQGAERVVFVDSATGNEGSGVAVLDVAETAARADGGYGHAAGLAYMLRLAPLVCDGPLPEIILVGVEGTPNVDTIAVSADLSVRLAIEGLSSDPQNRMELVKAQG